MKQGGGFLEYCVIDGGVLKCAPSQILLGKMLGEKAQLNACKDIVAIIEKLMNALELGPENAGANASAGNSETMYSQHLLVVSLQELGELIKSPVNQAKVGETEKVPYTNVNFEEGLLDPVDM